MDRQELCSRPPKNVNFFLNTVVHILILLLIISGFFFLYVSKLSQDKFKSEVTDLVDQNFNTLIKTADKDQVVKKLLSEVNVDRISDYYQNQTDQVKQLTNTWLSRVTIMAIAMLVFTIIMVVVILKSSCGQCIPILEIIKENVILFAFVGFVEISFFLFIAKKFVPTKPSLMMESMISSLKANFA